MLKKAGFAAALLFAASRAGWAQQPIALVVGTVRDRDGSAVQGASVQVFDTNGHSVGSGSTDDLGTFAVRLGGLPAQLHVSCRHCRPASVSLNGQTNVTVVVTRYHALESDVPDRWDLGALPYGRILDALALAPYVVPSADGRTVADRGLGRGRGLPIDDLAPMADFSGGRSGFDNVPDRYTRSIALVAASQAFRYGSSAGGGVFAIDQLDPDRSSVTADVGGASALALEPHAGIVFPAAALSGNAGTSVRRADLDLEGGLAGGVLRVGGTSASSESASGDGTPTDLRAARIAYATASRRYRTFADFTASALDVGENGGGVSAYRSSYINGDFRLERPGPIEVDLGAATQRQSGSYFLPPPGPYALTGRVDDDTIYVEAHAVGTRGRFDAGLGLSDVVQRASLPYGTLDGETLALLPSIAERVELGAGLSARAGFSESIRSPTLLEASGAVPPTNAAQIERGELAETALDYDAGRRVRGEVTLFREYLHGLGDRRLDGIGASLVWQVTPLVSLRAWSLRTDPADFTTGSLAGDVSRQLVWATYANPAGLRFDGILTRNAGLGPGALDLDGDVLVPLVSGAALDLGTSRRAGVRRYFVGLRIR